MKHFFLISLMAVFFFTAGNSVAQNTDTSTYKYKLVKTWYFASQESFGMQSKPDSTQKHDMIIFKSDGTYQMTVDGQSSTGKWIVGESSHFLTFTDDKSKQARNVKISGLIKDQMILKWQAPDLTSVFK